MSYKRIIFLALVLMFCNKISKAQGLSEDSLLKNTFSSFEYEKPKFRTVLSFKDRSFLYKINPLSYVSIGFMFTYQRFVSQQLGSICSYETSCSEHAKKAVEKHGIFKGVFLGFYQFQSCTSKSGYDHPDHNINKEGKIINPVELKDD